MKETDIKTAVNNACHRRNTQFPASGYWFFIDTPSVSGSVFSANALNDTSQLDKVARLVAAEAAKQHGKLTVVTERNALTIRLSPLEENHIWVISLLMPFQASESLFKVLVPHVHEHGGMLFVVSPYRHATILNQSSYSDTRLRLQRRLEELIGTRARPYLPPRQMPSETHTHKHALAHQLSSLVHSLKGRLTRVIGFHITRLFPVTIKYNLSGHIAHIQTQHLHPEGLNELLAWLRFFNDFPQLPMENFGCTLEGGSPKVYTPQSREQSELLNTLTGLKQVDLNQPNALGILGPAGNGKTHVLTALAFHFHQRNIPVCFLTPNNTTNFTRDIEPIRNNPQQFKVWVLDDLNEWTGYFANMFIQAIQCIAVHGGLLIITSNQTNLQTIFQRSFSTWLFNENTFGPEKKTVAQLFSDLFTANHFKIVQLTQPSTFTNPKVHDTGGADTADGGAKPATPSYQSSIFHQTTTKNLLSTKTKLHLGLGIAGAAISVTLASLTATVLWSGLLAITPGAITCAVCAGLFLLAAAYFIARGATSSCSDRTTACTI